MYIFERLLGGLLYTSVLLITIILLKFTNKQKIKNIMCVYLVSLVLLAYFFVPARGADLYRLIDLSNIYYSMPNNVFNEMLVGSIEPLSLIYLRFIGFLNNPKLMPAITTMIFYFLTFKIIIVENKEKLYKKNSNIVLILFLMSNSMFFEVISGIRSMLSIIFISYSLYSYFVLKEKNLKILLFVIIGILFHKLGIAIFLIVLFYIILEKIYNNKNYLSKLLYILILIGAILFIMSKENSNIFRVYNEFINYIINGNYSYFWEYLLGIIQLFVLIKINSNISKDQRYYDLSKLMKFINFLIILLLFEYNTFHRLVYFSSIISIPLALYYFENSKKKKLYFFILVSILSLMISLSRGNLSSYKFLSL